MSGGENQGTYQTAQQAGEQTGPNLIRNSPTKGHRVGHEHIVEDRPLPLHSPSGQRVGDPTAQDCQQYEHHEEYAVQIILEVRAE